MNEEDRLICNRFLDYANNCYNRDMPVVTDFLDLHSQTLFHTVLNKMPPVSFKAVGGYDLAERKVIIFTPYEGYPEPEAFLTLCLEPVHGRFAGDLGHRDYMGSILNLGITREKIGDIVCKDGKAYVFVTISMAPFLLEHITSVKNTQVKVSVVHVSEEELSPGFQEITDSVASIRLDSVIAAGFKSSRSHLISYIEEGRTAVNGQIITTNGYHLKEGDIISVRGLGKIRYVKPLAATKKGRQMILIHKYI